MLDAIRSRLGLPSPLVQASLLDRAVTVRAATIRATPDYDDAWVFALARHASSAFDIGANVGYDALMMLLCAGVQRVALVEANPSALAVAAENLIRNGVGDRAVFLWAFAGAEEGRQQEFWTVGSGQAGSMFASHADTARGRGARITVPTVTVDSLCRRFGIPDLVKIDVEGAESQVLEGACECASQGRTRWIVEMHSNPELPMRANAARVLEWCGRNGLAAWYLKEHRRLTEAAAIEKRGRCHLLLQPSADPYPGWLSQIRQGDPPRL